MSSANVMENRKKPFDKDDKFAHRPTSVFLEREDLRGILKNKEE